MTRRCAMLSCTVVIVGLVVMHGHAEAGAAAVLEELQARVEGNLESGAWSDASKRMVLAIWNDYRKAVADQKPVPTTGAATRPTTQPTGTTAQGKRWDGRSGAYTIGETKKRLEIVREDGVLIIVLNRQRIPAVVKNDVVWFTSGDVVVASVPQVGEHRHASLEFFTIRRVGEGLVFGGASAAGQTVPLSKIEE